MSVFEVLNNINVNGHTEDKPTGKKDKAGNEIKLTYLSWAWAYAELMKQYPDASYEVVKWDGRPYLEDPVLGYMVMTRLTIEGQTKEMWLPVMDARNNAMKSTPYVIHGKYGDTDVAAATMMDVNKAIMRCLVKNIGLFGLGLYIYAGEDLPESEAEMKPEEKKPEEKKPPIPAKPQENVATDPNAKITKVQEGALMKRIGDDTAILEYILKCYDISKLADLTVKGLEQTNRYWDMVKEKAHAGKDSKPVQNA